MRTFKTIIAAEVSSLLNEVSVEELLALIEYPSNKEQGDLSLPCFKLSRQLRKAPQAIAEDLKNRLQLEGVERIEASAGYLNFYLNKAHVAESVVAGILQQGELYGAQNIGSGKTVVIDYSSPNIAKPFHIAHLRSTVIGNALYRIHDFLGYACVGINHLGDWGTQFGKLIVAYRMWGDEAAIEEDGIDELLRLYVKFHDEADKDAGLNDEARAWFAKMEQGDAEALSLWQWFVDISLIAFNRIYELLGITFDTYTGESFYNDKTAPVVEELKAKGLLEEDSGAWLVRLDGFGMSPALILKQDGSSLYHTRDIAAAMYRKTTYDFDKAIYVTDYAQNLHFQQWFKVVELMGHEWAGDLVHVAFGRVSLDGMSLSTRKGNVVKLDEVLKQSIAKTKAIMEQRHQGMEHLDETARQVGVGAVIFHDLSTNRIKDIAFSWDEMLNFEGETGPYVQYAHARASSILAKAGAAASMTNEQAQQRAALLIDEASNPLLQELSLFGERVELAMHKLEPSIVTRYLIDVAQAFNRFYHECPILLDHVPAPLREARLALVRCVQTVLRNGLRLIGLEAPEQI
ncbi:arginine--tRNA ligase [Paenibacillus rhizovicinus]|uniref:Arginine--tRNA ligase n=1 Tax=Paenibacillus rhizovicinus TaxID=2704463 RepID=A0A6C0PAX8_9BACL|nr:arginine--tRNA ligase [Paenibacillus rhizovicinus]QHW34813.1 arginine--tRNA ligase [Paenibacillus rhizovicinus]